MTVAISDPITASLVAFFKSEVSSNALCNVV